MTKYIQDSILLTKEAIAEHILRQRTEQAKRYGLTLEEYMEAIEKGHVVYEQQTKSSIPVSNINSKF